MHPGAKLNFRMHMTLLYVTTFIMHSNLDVVLSCMIVLVSM
jgi:hypothetical protein